MQKGKGASAGLNANGNVAGADGRHRVVAHFLGKSELRREMETARNVARSQLSASEGGAVVAGLARKLRSTGSRISRSL